MHCIASRSGGSAEQLEFIPQAVVGHSSGEIAAAYCAGALSREAAWKVSYLRGIFIARLSSINPEQQGSMMSVALSELELGGYLTEIANSDKIAVGCINSPKNLTLTGDQTVMVAFKDLMERKQIFARILAVNVAYHSTRMNDIAEEYLAAIEDIGSSFPAGLEMRHPTMFSSVTGKAISREFLARGKYWVQNLVSKVRFSDALSAMCHPNGVGQKSRNQVTTNAIHHLVEVGPRAALQRPVKETLGDVRYNSMLRAGATAVQSTLEVVGRLYTYGHTVNLRR